MIAIQDVELLRGAPQLGHFRADLATLCPQALHGASLDFIFFGTLCLANHPEDPLRNYNNREDYYSGKVFPNVGA